MKNYINNLTLFFCCCLVIMSSCTERFRPKLTDFENILVIDGQLTNEPGPYKVSLSMSSELGTYINYEPLENAEVTVIEEDGISEVLTEVSKGEYWTNPDGIQGKIGNSYKLQIVRADGRVYETEYQELKAPTTIADVRAEVETRFFTEENADVTGYQFYVDAAESPNEQDYFLWLTNATFKYRAEYLIYGLYDGEDHPFPNRDSLMTCWRRDTVNYVATYNTANYASPEVKNIPLHFVKSTERALSIRYSPLVKQYTVSKEAFEFWQTIASQLQTDAALYTKQPFQTRGNLKNINDTDEAVLGFFLVAGVSEKRIFVNAPDDLPLFELSCFFDYLGYVYRFAEPPTSFPLYIARGPTGGLALAPRGCLDCRDNGGDIFEPEYWED